MGGNRDALLEAAGRCLLQRGYANTSARALVAESGTNLGAIGYHFGSKEALLNEAISVNVSSWINELGGLLRRNVAAGKGLRSVFEEVFTAVGDHQPLVAAFLDALAVAGHSADLRRDLAASCDRFRGEVTDALQPLFDQIGVDDDAHAFSSLLLALVDGLIIQCLLAPGSVPTGAELARVLSLLSRLEHLSQTGSDAGPGSSGAPA